jgi:hypothetical protein
VANVEMVADAAQAGSREAALVESMLGAASRTRFEPASYEGLPVEVSMVWVVAHTTVRGAVVGGQVNQVPVDGRRRSAGIRETPAFVLA